MDPIRDSDRDDSINVLLVHVVDKGEDLESALQHAQGLLDMSMMYERSRLEIAQQRADLMIETKKRDPDEILKRDDARLKRRLKGLFGFLGLSCLGLVGVGLLMEANFLVLMFLSGIGAMTVALLGPLISGDSISTTDVVRILRAIRLLPSKTLLDAEKPSNKKE